MTIEELKQEIAKIKYENPTAIEDKLFNTAIDYCLKMIDVYARFREREDYPLGKNDYQE